MATGIDTYNETSLHAGLKSWYSDDSARFEVAVDGFIVDVVHHGILLEIQTANFTAMRRKIQMLIESHLVRLVFHRCAGKVDRSDGSEGGLSRPS